MEAWRAGVDHSNAAITADVDPQPTQVPTRVALARAITGPDDQSAYDSQAMAFAEPARNPMSAAVAPAPAAASAPQASTAAPEQHFGHSLFVGVNLSDKTREALVAAGLSMLASRSPFFGVAVAGAA
jgi:hypothetical protein